MRRLTALDYALLGVLALLWGSAFLLIKIAVETVPPLTMAAARIWIAVAALLIFCRMRGHRLPRDPRQWGLFFALGIAGTALPFFLIAWGERRIDSGLAAIIMSFTPLATFILAHFMTRQERLNPARITGVLLGLAGVFTLIGAPTPGALTNDAWGEFAIVLAALAYAVAAVLARRTRAVPPEVTALAVGLCAGAVITPVALGFDVAAAGFDPSLASVIALVFLGVMSTALASLLSFHLIVQVGASTFSLTTYLVPVVGAFFGAFWLDEKISASMVLALMLILACVGIATFNRRRIRQSA